MLVKVAVGEQKAHHQIEVSSPRVEILQVEGITHILRVQRVCAHEEICEGDVHDEEHRNDDQEIAEGGLLHIRVTGG